MLGVVLRGRFSKYPKIIWYQSTQQNKCDINIFPQNYIVTTIYLTNCLKQNSFSTFWTALNQAVYLTQPYWLLFSIDVISETKLNKKVQTVYSRILFAFILIAIPNQYVLICFWQYVLICFWQIPNQYVLICFWLS